MAKNPYTFPNQNKLCTSQRITNSAHQNSIHGLRTRSTTMKG